MRTVLVFVVVILAIVHSEAGRTQLAKQRTSKRGWQAGSDYHGYSAGSGLRTIANGSASRASSAVVNQYAAAQQAAYIAKSDLAKEAIHAATAAQAALSGKEALYKDLEQQIEEAQDALAEEQKQLQLAESSVEAAKKAADTTDEQAAALADALKNANSAAEQARVAVVEAGAELKSQSSMVNKAQERLNALEAKWSLVEVDYEATRISALKASAAAQAARDNASLARAYANQKVEESVWKSDEESLPKYEAPGLSLYRYLHR